MFTLMQAAFGAVLGFLVKTLTKVITAKLKKATNLLLQVLIRGYCDTCACDSNKDDDQANRSQNLRVTIRVNGQTVMVDVDSDPRKEQSPQEKMLTDQCRLPVCRRRLIQLLRAAAS